MPPTQRLARNLRYLRLLASLTQEQAAEAFGFEFKFYQKLEGAHKAQIKLETVQRLAKPFGIEAWLLLAPESYLKQTKVRLPKARTPSVRGPRTGSRAISNP